MLAACPENLVGSLIKMLPINSSVAQRLQETLLPDVPAAVERLHEALLQHRRDRRRCGSDRAA